MTLQEIQALLTEYSVASPYGPSYFIDAVYADRIPDGIRRKYVESKSFGHATGSKLNYLTNAGVRLIKGN